MAAAHRHPLLEAGVALAALGLGLALMALPKPPAEGDRDAQLADQLAVVRTAILEYGMDHGSADGPARPGADGDARTFLDQLTAPTTREGSTAALAGPRDRRYFGPYLAGLPVNPVNGKATVRVHPGPPGSVVADNTAGWVYLPANGAFFADIPWDDARGVPYLAY